MHFYALPSALFKSNIVFHDRVTQKLNLRAQQKRNLLQFEAKNMQKASHKMFALMERKTPKCNLKLIEFSTKAFASSFVNVN